MNYKAFQLSKTTHLLIYRDFDDDGIDIVEIKVYWIDQDGDHNMEIEKMKFSAAEMCRAFITDFSQDSAEIFCNSILSKYEDSNNPVCIPDILIKKS